MPIVSNFSSPRVAVDGDVPSLVGAINRAYVVEEFFITGTRTTEAQARELMAQPDVRFLVIDCPAGGIAASVCMKINGDRGYFSMLAVDPAYQGHGLARRLIEAVESACRAAAVIWTSKSSTCAPSCRRSMRSSVSRRTARRRSRTHTNCCSTRMRSR
jgi:GNAT superfamily N-acetyltransferase